MTPTDFQYPTGWTRRRGTSGAPSTRCAGAIVQPRSGEPATDGRGVVRDARAEASVDLVGGDRFVGLADGAETGARSPCNQHCAPGQEIDRAPSGRPPG